MCSGTQPKLFGGAQPLGSGGNFQAPITYPSGIPQNFDAGNPANFPKPTPPAPLPPGVPVHRMPIGVDYGDPMSHLRHGGFGFGGGFGSGFPGRMSMFS